MYSKTKYISRSFSARMILCRRMMFSWPASSCKYITSRKVLCASVALRNASKHFFNATTCFVRLSTAFHTIPYACNDTKFQFHRLLKGSVPQSSSFGVFLPRFHVKGQTYPFSQLCDNVVLLVDMFLQFIRHLWCSISMKRLWRSSG